MQKKISILGVFILYVLFALLSGCSKSDTDKDINMKKSKEIIAKGRYMEENYTLPRNLNEIYALEKLEDHSIYLVASGERDPFEVYSSKDEGKHWDKIQFDSSVVPAGNDISAAAVDTKGNIVLAYGVHETNNGVKLSAFKGNISYIKVDSKGKKTPLNISLPSSPDRSDSLMNSISSLKFATNGDLFGMDRNYIIYQVDSSNGKIKDTYSSNDISHYGLVNNSLLIVTSNHIEQYNISSGKKDKNLDILNKYFTSKNTQNNNILISSGKENELYFCNEKGLFHYVLGGNVVEQLVDGSLSMFSSSDMTFTNMAVKKDGDFLVTYESTDQQQILKNYTFSKQADAAPSNEITVYSLTDNTTIRQQITKFQSENRNVHVIFKVGMNGKDAVSTSDALKTLNTEIMADKGPDVLILNGMPVVSYVDKGVLADISGVIGKYTEKDEVFKNIVEAYKSKGKIYASPIRFKIPIIIGHENVLGQIHNLDTMADYAENALATDPNIPLVDIYDANMLVAKLFPVIAKDWFNSDGSLSKSKLVDSLTDLKKIYDTSTQKMSKDTEKKFQFSKEIAGMSISQFYDPYMDVSQNSPNIVDRLSHLEVGTIGDFNSIAFLSSANNEDQTVSYKMLNEGKHSFVPGITVGMSSKSKNKDFAKKFISYLYSETAQVTDYTGGFPVNKKEFEKGQAEPSPATMSNINFGLEKAVTWPSQEQFAEFTSMVETLNTPTFQDDIIFEAVLEAFDKCASGEQSVQAAADSIMEKLNLYLSE
jgi:ABC-type glycerol-3-phosphate transport system substrate-binding protein